MFVLLQVLSDRVRAHGEDKLGPNGGYIKMPGAFHVELVPVGKDQLKVFLLDMEWKNPIVENSQVKIEFHNKVALDVKAHESAHALSSKLLDCKILKNYYLCKLPSGADLNSTNSELSVESTRKGQKGLKVVYALPLKVEALKDKKGEKDKKEDAHHHH